MRSIIVLFLIASCTTTQNITQTQDIQMIHDVPFYPQEDYQCGPASIASVMGYWNVHVDPDEIGKEIFSKSAGGTVTIDMMLYAEKKGFHVDQLKGSMEILKNSVDSGYPIIVLVDYGMSVIQINHFMVVTGYSNGGVIVHSGKFPNRVISQKDFLSAWKKTDYWSLLIKKP
jgi:ABC-type bacteriocin/lantibiotic exporter with double-glycine peptidase domain